MKKIILFIEDDLPTIEVYKTALERVGYDVEPMLLGQEAVRRIEEIEKGEAKKPDLVLLDLILPDMNGIEVLERLRKSKEAREVPVFILTNYTDEELEKRGLLLKTERYLLKTSYTPRELAEIVKDRLNDN